MADDEISKEPQDEGTEKPEEEPTPGHHEGLGERLHHAEHSVEEALKDAVARVENRVILAGEAETSASPEVNFASALEVAINPPHADDSDEDETATNQATPAVTSDNDVAAEKSRPPEKPAD